MPRTQVQPGHEGSRSELSEGSVNRSEDRDVGCDKEPLGEIGCSERREAEIFQTGGVWRPRVALHDVFHLNPGEVVWNVMRRGLFAEMKLWINEYGNVCCKAFGKVNVVGVSEESIVEVNEGDHLRKILNLSHFQWSALCETVKNQSSVLHFKSLDGFNDRNKSPLEMLWFFICKRRHFLPNICIFGKFSGAVKLMNEFNVVPKIIVTDVRDFRGREIC